MKMDLKSIAKTTLIFALVLMMTTQIFMLREINDLKLKVQYLHSEISGVSSKISNQTYTMQMENALYRFSGIEYEDVLIYKTPGVLAMKMLVKFDKLPADAEVKMAYRGTFDSFSESEQQYDTEQTVNLVEKTSNVFLFDANFDTNKNYELSIVISGNGEQVREVLGVLPILEWSQNTHQIQVTTSYLGVTTPDNGRLDFKLELFKNGLHNYENYSSPHSYPVKSLYDFDKLENPFETDVVEATYRIYYLDALIKEGKLETAAQIDGYWHITDQATFKADINGDYATGFRIEVDTLTSGGTIKTYKTDNPWY